MSELTEIKIRLTALETKTKERWDAHDQRSSEHWSELKERMKVIQEFITGTPERRESCMKETKDYTKTMIGYFLGIPAVISAIFGVMVLFHNLKCK